MDEEQVKPIAPPWSDCNIIEQVAHFGGIDDENYKWEAKDKVELAIVAILTALIDDDNYTSFEVY